jgi:hypothetical protein
VWALVFYQVVELADVVSALEKLRALESLIRIALLNQSMRLAFPRRRARAQRCVSNVNAAVCRFPARKEEMLYKIAAMDIQKKVRMVVVPI